MNWSRENDYRHKLTGITSTSVFIILIFCFSGCSEEKLSYQPLSLGGLTMGTSYNVKINEPELELSAAEINAGLNLILVGINQKMSTYIDDSELSLLNTNHSPDWIPVSAQLHYVLSEANQVSQMTAGCFDITVGPLVNLWGFGPTKQNYDIPDADSINEALALSGFKNVHLGENPLRVQKAIPHIYIDLSGIAKGYAVDRMAEYLEQAGIHNYMAEIGGEIRAKGVNERNRSWRIGIEKPLSMQRSVQRIIDLNNIAMATSGDYRNYFEKDGQRYSHTIDPRNGRPIEHNLVSVTVLHESATRADALATALLVMGKEAAFDLAVEKNLPVLFIERDKDGFQESYTDAFRHYLPEA